MTENLLIEMVEKDGSIVAVKDIPGFKILARGSGNYIRFHEESQFVSCGMSLQSNMHITIGKSRYAANNLKIWGNGSQISIGDNFSCWGVEIRCHEAGSSVIIGDDCMFSEEILIYPTDVHAIFDIQTEATLNLAKPIIIGNYIWCGRRVNILKGAHIGDNCILGMAATVNGRFEQPHCIIAGNPAKIVKKNVGWSRENPDVYNKRLLDKSL